MHCENFEKTSIDQIRNEVLLVNSRQLDCATFQAVSKMDDASHAAVTARSLDLLLLQVQAFLDAAEDVDIEPETLQDLLESIPDDDESEHVQGVIEDESQDVLADSQADVELDISALFAVDGNADGSVISLP